MRCRACDVLLKDFELKHKLKDGTHADMCSVCTEGSSVYDGYEYDRKGQQTIFTSVKCDYIPWGYAGGIQDEADVDLSIIFETSLDR